VQQPSLRKLSIVSKLATNSKARRREAWLIDPKIQLALSHIQISKSKIKSICNKFFTLKAENLAITTKGENPATFRMSIKLQQNLKIMMSH